ncbi:MAG: CHAT domain-containing protein [Deltaproteobacteria bacterium]|nr:CHAT domain-containing protein [Deltaproteobacteria bacterium]
MLREPSRDPRAAAARLYDAVIAPVEADLVAAGTRTLALSLDGMLRYVPAAAFWDGERWLAERWPTALFTESTPLRLSDPPAGRQPTVRAMGVTEPWPGFQPLPGVVREMAAVVRSSSPPGSPDGALEGRASLNRDFTRESISESLASDAAVVHVASHFRLDPDSLENTVLLLGDGDLMSLKEMGAGGMDFGGLDLLTLSACDTASGSMLRTGREIESLGETVLRAGASAVLATLMPVDDLAAPDLMREFYRLRYIEGRGKAEALQGAQLAVMRASGSPCPEILTADAGRSSAAGSRQGAHAAETAQSPSEGRATAAPSVSQPETPPARRDERGTALSAGSSSPHANAVRSAPRWEGGGFSHPYYWSPFIIMGSFR